MQTEEVRLLKYDRLPLKCRKKTAQRQYATRIIFGFLFAGKMRSKNKELELKELLCFYVGEGSIFRPFSYTESASINRTFRPSTKPVELFLHPTFPGLYSLQTKLYKVLRGNDEPKKVFSKSTLISMGFPLTVLVRPSWRLLTSNSLTLCTDTTSYASC
jgi:hypothetical protein